MSLGNPAAADMRENKEAGQRCVGSELDLGTGVQDGLQIQSNIHSVRDVSSVPNGGLQAWVQVAGAFCLYFNTWGLINSFGSYQTYYENELIPESDPSAISWIGSIQGFLLLLVGALTGPTYDAGHFRLLIGSGTFLVVFGQMMLSISSEYWQILLAQAFCVGIGTGLLFVPGAAILSTYFTTTLASAVGIATAGSSLGGVVYPIALHRLIGQIGFPWAARVTGFIALAVLLVPNFVMRVRVLPASRRSILDLPAFKEAPYTLFTLGVLVIFMGLYTPLFYIQLYAAPFMDRSLAFYMLAITNACSIPGRIFPNIVADRTGTLNVLVPCAGISGILILCLPAVSSSGSLIVFCLLYGFFSGTLVSLLAPSLVSLTADRARIGTRMGMSFSCIAIGLLIGTPIGGAIVKKHGFTSLWIYGGVCTVLGTSLLVLVRLFKTGLVLVGKA